MLGGLKKVLVVVNGSQFMKEFQYSKQVFILVARELFEGGNQILKLLQALIEEYKDLYSEESSNELPPLRGIQH